MLTIMDLVRPKDLFESSFRSETVGHATRDFSPWVGVFLGREIINPMISSARRSQKEFSESSLCFGRLLIGREGEQRVPSSMDKSEKYNQNIMPKVSYLKCGPISRMKSVSKFNSNVFI